MAYAAAMLPMHLLERAFVLARTGEYPTVNDLKVKLKAEGYDQVEAHLTAPALARQLRTICTQAGAISA